MTGPAPSKAYLALLAVCLFWGTTYLGIRMGLESFPPFLLLAARYTLAGGIMVAAAIGRGAALPRGRELAAACFSGVLVLGIGNGCLIWAELTVPSGLACLIVTISPFWMVGAEALLPGGERLHSPTIAGMAVGLAGSALLFAPDPGTSRLNTAFLAGFLLLQVGMAGWSFGSIYQRRRVASSHPIVVAGVQQLAAGIAAIPLTFLAGQNHVNWNGRGVGALLYLVVFGSIVGYSAYAYALDRLPVAVVSVYPYINSVVAVTLGWLFYREPFGTRELAAMAIIFAGVALVKRSVGPGLLARRRA